ncbi:MAG: hypothetical protein IJ740_08505 [Ruminococcus sp.]|nr:hypothetical protein [Ruminococcus sp.]
MPDAKEIIFTAERKDTRREVSGYYLCLHGQQPDNSDLHIIVDSHGEYHPIDPETLMCDAVRYGHTLPLTDQDRRLLMRESMPIFNCTCSECGAWCFDDDTYCAECGAIMEG